MLNKHGALCACVFYVYQKARKRKTWQVLVWSDICRGTQEAATVVVDGNQTCAIRVREHVPHTNRMTVAAHGHTVPHQHTHTHTHTASSDCQKKDRRDDERQG